MLLRYAAGSREGSGDGANLTSGRASEEKEVPLASFGDFREELVLMLEPSPLALFLLDFLLNNPIMTYWGGVQ
jgi:hypothetical protein